MNTVIIKCTLPAASESHCCWPGEFETAFIRRGTDYFRSQSYASDVVCTDSAVRDLFEILSLQCPTGNFCITITRSTLQGPDLHLEDAVYSKP